MKRHRCGLHAGRGRYKATPAEIAPVCPASPALTVCPGRSRSPPEAFQNTLDSRVIQATQTHLRNTPLPTPVRASCGCHHCLRCRWARAALAERGQTGSGWPCPSARRELPPAWQKAPVCSSKWARGARPDKMPSCESNSQCERLC